LTALARVEMDRNGQRGVIAIHGEIDISNAHEVSAAIESIMPNAAETLVIDLSGTTYLDSSGVQLLFLLAQRLQTRRQELMLVVPEEAPIRAVLELTGMPRVVRMEAALEEA
jgi:anti-anti-sigma factor